MMHLLEHIPELFGCIGGAYFDPLALHISLHHITFFVRIISVFGHDYNMTVVVVRNDTIQIATEKTW